MRVAADLLERDFRPTGPNQTWAADITYTSTWEGFLYLAHVQDLFSMVVGWSMAEHLRAELGLDALEMALYRRRPEPRADPPLQTTAASTPLPVRQALRHCRDRDLDGLHRRLL